MDSNDFFSGQHAAADGGAGLLPISPSSTDPQIPLFNLSLLHRRMDSLHQSLSASLQSRSKLDPRQIELASSEISSAIRLAILNATALLNSSQPLIPPPAPPVEDLVNSSYSEALGDSPAVMECESGKAVSFREIKELNCEIVELDAVELLADHVHFCDICGKGFKRDANLRMHMRAHGNQFKTPEALAKPGRVRTAGPAAGIRFSCPFPGCNRNKAHRKFRPLKSAICVKNYFKRSHCPKMYACNRCHKKSFSVVADLKSHLKHCGECRWKCSCGTSFSRKDKLFGHLALFEGHMPAVMGDPGMEKVKEAEVGEENDAHKDDESSSEFGSLDALLDGFSAMDECSFEGLLGLQSEEARLEDLGKV